MSGRLISVLLKRLCFALFAALMLVSLPATTAVGQDYPTRPIRLVVAFPPGGTTDFAARLIAEKVSTILGQNLIVENKPGGNGAIAAEFVARSEPDGYNLFFTTLGAMAINPSLRSDMNYNPQTDFDPVAMLVRNTILLAVKSGSSIKTLGDFVALAKSNKKVTVGVTGIGAATYLCGELLQKAAEIKLQIIPYRGAAQALTDLLGGRIDAMFAEIPVLLGSISGGNVSVLASTSRSRSEVIPDVPTFTELGFADVLAENWAGVVAPARVPQAILTKLGSAFEEAVKDANILRQLARSGVTPSFARAEVFRDIIRSETQRWQRVIRENGVRSD